MARRYFSQTANLCRRDSDGSGVEFGGGEYRRCHRHDSDGEQSGSSWKRRRADQDWMGEARNRLFIETSLLPGKEQHMPRRRFADVQQR